MLLVTCGSNKELVLDVDEVQAVSNDIYVRICNGVLARQLSPRRVKSQHTSLATPLLHSVQLLTN